MSDENLAPIDINVKLIFGEEKEAVGWARKYPFYEIPTDGSIVKLALSDEDLYSKEDGENEEEKTSEELFFEVLYTSIDVLPEDLNINSNQEFDPDDCLDEHTNMMILGGRCDLPEMKTIFQLEDAGWERLADDEVEYLTNLCSELPPLAGVHNVVVLIGEPGTDAFQVWAQSFTPQDTTVPVFGGRTFFDPVNSASQDLNELLRISDDGVYDEREIDLSSQGCLVTGLPSVVLHSEIVEPGVADVIFWTKSLGDIEGFDLMASGWAQVCVPESFDPELFEATNRIRLAISTHITWQKDESLGVADDGDSYLELRSYEIDNPESVSPSDYHLLPDPLVELCAMERSKHEMKEI